MNLFLELSNCQFKVGQSMEETLDLLRRRLAVFGRIDDEAIIPYLIYIVSHVRRSARLRLCSNNRSQPRRKIHI